MSQKIKSELQVVSAFVPFAVKQIVEKIAGEEGRSTSQVVRRLLEDSPRVKAALRQSNKN